MQLDECTGYEYGESQKVKFDWMNSAASGKCGPCISDDCTSRQQFEAFVYQELMERELNWRPQSPTHSANTPQKVEIIFSRENYINTNEFMELLTPSSAFDIYYDAERPWMLKKRLVYELNKRGLQCTHACRFHDQEQIERFVSFFENTKPNRLVRMYQAGVGNTGQFAKCPILHTSHDAAVEFARKHWAEACIAIDVVAVVVKSEAFDSVCVNPEYEPVYEDEVYTEYRVWYNLQTVQVFGQIIDARQSQGIRQDEIPSSKFEGCNLHWMEEPIEIDTRFQPVKRGVEITLPYPKRVRLA
jgi:hypothetical protein